MRKDAFEHVEPTILMEIKAPQLLDFNTCQESLQVQEIQQNF